MSIEKLESLLAHNKIIHNGITAVVGDTITRYKVHIDPLRFRGIEKFTALDENVAYLLGLKTKPIIGSSYEEAVVTIDTTTEKRTSVEMRSLLPSTSWFSRLRKTNSPEIDGTLPMIIGRDVNRKPIVVDLAEQPHLLVSGTTGSGKSVGIRAMITSLLYLRPRTQFLFIDPKRVELSTFNDIAYSNRFKTPFFGVLSDPKEVDEGLEALITYVEEMFAHLEKKGFTSVAQLKAPQYVVLVIDELADLVMNNKEVIGRLLKVVQKSRAAGVHVIAATQRPSVDVINGVVKANFPGRLAFRVSSHQDSSTILGTKGAECLLGKGDFLLQTISGHLSRGQGAFVTDKQVKSILRERRVYCG